MLFLFAERIARGKGCDPKTKCAIRGFSLFAVSWIRFLPRVGYLSQVEKHSLYAAYNAYNTLYCPTTTLQFPKHYTRYLIDRSFSAAHLHPREKISKRWSHRYKCEREIRMKRKFYSHLNSTRKERHFHNSIIYIIYKMCWKRRERERERKEGKWEPLVKFLLQISQGSSTRNERKRERERSILTHLRHLRVDLELSLLIEGYIP